MTRSNPARRPLVRPGFAKWATVVFVLLIPFVVHAVWQYVEMRRLRMRIDAIVSRGEPITEHWYVSLSDGAADADRYYRAAAALGSSVARDLPSAPGPRAIVALRGGDWSSAIVSEVRRQLDPYRDALDLADRAATLPFAGLSPRPDQYLIGELIRLAQLCELRALVRAADGDGDAALESVYVKARAARTVEWPILFSEIPVILDRAHPSAAALARLAPALEAIDRDDRVKRLFVRIRAGIIDDLNLTRRRPHWEDVVLGPYHQHHAVEALDTFSALAAWSEHPWPQRLDVMSKVAWRGEEAARRMWDAQARFEARQIRNVRCARLRVSGGTLKLVDPFTGRFLEGAACKL